MTFAELTSNDLLVLESAVSASSRLYLKGLQEVGAAVRTTGGHIFSGIHFNSASPFATICGEVTALSCMVAAGHRDLETIVAVWQDDRGHHFLLPPCGRCRVLIRDFNPEAWVILSTLRDNWDATAITKPGKIRIVDLLPL